MEKAASSPDLYAEETKVQLPGSSTRMQSNYKATFWMSKPLL